MSDVQQMVDAIKHGDAQLVEQLLRDAPALASGRTDRGESPVLTAAFYAQHDLLALLAPRAELDLFEAAVVGDVDRMSHLLSADPDPACLNAHGLGGWTALHLAAFYGQTAAAERLLEAGADVASRSDNAEANTPLHAALAGREQGELVELLLRHGADVRASGGGGYTPLHLAASRGNARLAQRLLAAGADRAAISGDGQTPSAVAAAHGHAEVAALLAPPE